jgi:hypothetical protein
VGNAEHPFTRTPNTRYCALLLSAANKRRKGPPIGGKN